MKGDIVLIPFPNSDLTQVKLWSALVLYEDLIEDETTIAYISSNNPFSFLYNVKGDETQLSTTN